MSFTNRDLSKLKVEMSRVFDQKFKLSIRDVFKNLITREEFNKQENKKFKEIKKIHQLLTNLNKHLSAH